MGILQGLRFSNHGIARRFVDETGRAESRIPVVIREMVESALRDGASIASMRLERNSKVDASSSRLALARGDDSGLLPERRAHVALVRMRG